ncbi:hypothetical protein OPW36_16285 [Vibrio europaeus]|uniref:pilus assembly protein n=1 Tax=Vibrio europaeus TaxID=300876 RepID=UPI00233F528A|nr:hypothetical protein [Vibrio europaeus]MDC5805648.1 hypothetical protein [Vibrio europaeus]MDC5826278.1 hypothetical protein [Vibrio europaeus]MDC5831643.1 hypothetical protein [Vibrio europaeus]MDC5834598.1 hypothetical protein [Vibrio europaeus]
MNGSIKNQSGAAAIWFVFVAFAILGMGALGVEGARYITEKAHLGDVMEATAVAVSESDDIRSDKSNNGDFKPEQRRRVEKVAKAWIGYLIPDKKSIDVTVSRTKDTTIRNKNGQCVKGFDGKCIQRTVHKYLISSKTTLESWMHMKAVPSFKETQVVYNNATAARVRVDFEPVDVVFVADFSGSMNQPKKDPRLPRLKTAINDVTSLIFEATKELQEKHDTADFKIEDSSFAFVPFTKRIIVKNGSDFYCASMLRPKSNSDFVRPMLEQEFSYLGTLKNKKKRNKWMTENGYSSYEKQVMETYLNYAWKGYGSFYKPLDCNRGSGSWRCNSAYSDHISYRESATKLQLTTDYVLSTPMKIGNSSFRTKGYCSTNYWGQPRYYNIDRVALANKQQLVDFNNQIKSMTADGGTDMYQGLLAAPGQFHGAKNKNRFIFVLSDGDENTDSFKKLVKNGLCKTMRNQLSVNDKGESVKFEMFVIGLQFSNKKDWAYRECFGKHIYEVQDLRNLKDVIMELLSSTTSYNVER